MNDPDHVEMEFQNMSPEEFRDISKQLAAALADSAGGAEPLPKPEDFSISKGQLMGPAEWSAIVIAAHAGAPVAAKMVRDVWTGIVFPRLRARYGQRVRLKGKAKA